MSVAVSQAESRVVLTNISWSTFEAILAETNRRSARFTFDRGGCHPRESTSVSNDCWGG